MRITTLGHSCLFVQTEQARLLIDPGGYSHGFEHLTGLTAVLVTHQHADHLDRTRLPGVLAANPGVPLFTDPMTAALLAGDGLPAQPVRAADTLDVGTQVRVHGHDHAVVHPDLPMVDNVSYLVAGRLRHRR